MMAIKVRTGSNFYIVVTGEQREGFCENCRTKTEKQYYMEGNRKRVKAICPQCGGQGRLIVRTYSIRPPLPPQCLSFRCVWRFFKNSLFVLLITAYHAKRVAYATQNRNKEILERYRTGEPSPQTIWQAIHANLKLRCPVCRKYNVDPFYGGK